MKLLFLIKSKYKRKNIITFFLNHISILLPIIGLIGFVKSGKKYLIPWELKPHKAITLGLRWFLKAARLRQEATFLLRLYGEFCDLKVRRGSSWKQRKQFNQLIYDNRQYTYMLSRKR